MASSNAPAQCSETVETAARLLTLEVQKPLNRTDSEVKVTLNTAEYSHPPASVYMYGCYMHAHEHVR